MIKKAGGNQRWNIEFHRQITEVHVHSWSAGEHCSVASSGRLLGMKPGPIGLGWLDTIFSEWAQSLCPFYNFYLKRSLYL